MRFFSIRDSDVRSRPVVMLALASALLMVALDASAQIDLTGRWRMGEGTPDPFADIVQTDTAVTVTWTQDLGGGPVLFNLNGTFDQTTLTATASGLAEISMQVYDTGDVLDGTIVYFFAPLAGYGHIHFTRCECFDGNEIDGDGCSSVCRVEPCFSCTAEPSVCTPSPDTAACDDGNDCTTGETCSAGVCGTGSPVSPCVNLDGLWIVTSQIPSLGSEFDEVVDQRLMQRNSFVSVVGASQGLGDNPSSVGTIDTASGAMTLISRGGSGPCTVSSDFAGTASLDNSTFSGSGASYTTALGGGTCLGFTQNKQGVRLTDASVPSLSDWGLLAATLILMALGLLWATRCAARRRC